MNVGLYFCACGESYVSDTAYQTARCLSCSTELKLETEPTLKMLSVLENNQLEHLWNLFSGVSFDTKDECITERFLCWLPTTHRFAIWLWFAKQYKGTFIDLPGKLVWLEQGRVQPYACDCGQHIPIGNSCYFNLKVGKVLCDSCGKRDMMDLWLMAGYQNPWIRTADDPDFDRNSFCVIDTVEELLEKLRYANWCMGNAFVYKNLAFINQVEGGGEWLTIKDWCAFDSITFSSVLKHGDKYALRYIQKLLKHPIEYRNQPDYSLIEALS